ncbi:MAG: hypothetical protein KC609_07995 [Myxococcales bacterium]|nr:hypothetical protein [Myxococcales bacterium]
MKECPRCHLQFPDTANFCPMDREKLVSVETSAAPAASPAKIKFSETQWFMAATNVEQLKDSEPTEADEQTAKFSRQVEIPEDVRDQYTLSKESTEELEQKKAHEFAKAISAGDKFEEPTDNKSMMVSIIVAVIVVLIIMAYFVFGR